MIRVLILYFLSIKPTHGYEIQKYIQLNHMNDWTRIQSGSIYYALSKLEKGGFITLVREENVGQKVRKIYDITDRGREELKCLMIKELSKPIYDMKSDKFIAYPCVKGMDKAMIIKAVKRHIAKLEEEKAYIIKWQEYKVGNNSLAIVQISFEMMLSSLDYQIKWHRALIDEIDQCIHLSETISQLIEHVDFSEISDLNQIEVQDKLNN